MSFGWQDLAAWLAVAVAVVFLLWRLLKKRHSPGGVPGCESCSGCLAASPRPLVSLDPPRPKGKG